MAKGKKMEEPEIEEVKQLTKGPTDVKKRDMVIFWKSIQTNSGEKLEGFAALVLGKAATESNFQVNDGAVDLKVFTSAKGGNDEVKHGVMFSPEKKANRWTWDE